MIGVAVMVAVAATVVRSALAARSILVVPILRADVHRRGASMPAAGDAPRGIQPTEHAAHDERLLVACTN